MDIGQIVLIVVIVLLIIAYPILVSARNKKERQKLDEQTNSLKRGDKVMTTSGIVGTVVDLYQDGERKLVTIETGSGKNKGYMSIDAYAIYSIMNDNFIPNDVKAESDKKEEKNEEKKDSAQAKTVKENKKTETKKENKENKTTESKK